MIQNWSFVEWTSDDDDDDEEEKKTQISKFALSHWPHAKEEKKNTEKTEKYGII